MSHYERHSKSIQGKKIVLEALFKRWQLVHHTLINLCRVLQRDLGAPPTIKVIEKMVKIMIEEIKYIYVEEPRVKDNINSFHTFKHWTIPPIVD